MSLNKSNEGIPDFLKRIGGWVIAVVGFLTGLVTFINLIKGNTGLLTSILLIISIAILWASFLYSFLESFITRNFNSQGHAGAQSVCLPRVGTQIRLDCYLRRSHPHNRRLRSVAIQ